jgi:hypothetical protein
MGAMKRFVFIVGFIFGLSGFVLIAGNVLLYLLTGKLPSIEAQEDGPPILGLIAPKDVVTIIKEQMDRERAGRMATQPESGELSQEVD